MLPSLLIFFRILTFVWMILSIACGGMINWEHPRHLGWYFWWFHCYVEDNDDGFSPTWRWCYDDVVSPCSCNRCYRFRQCWTLKLYQLRMRNRQYDQHCLALLCISAFDINDKYLASFVSADAIIQLEVAAVADTQDTDDVDDNNNTIAIATSSSILKLRCPTTVRITTDAGVDIFLLPTMFCTGSLPTEIFFRLERVLTYAIFPTLTFLVIMILHSVDSRGFGFVFAIIMPLSVMVYLYLHQFTLWIPHMVMLPSLIRIFEFCHSFRCSSHFCCLSFFAPFSSVTCDDTINWEHPRHFGCYRRWSTTRPLFPQIFFPWSLRQSWWQWFSPTWCCTIRWCSFATDAASLATLQRFKFGRVCQHFSKAQPHLLLLLCSPSLRCRCTRCYRFRHYWTTVRSYPLRMPKTPT